MRVKGIILLSIFLCLIPVSSVIAASNPEEANIDWKQFKGETIKVLFVAHPWQKAIEPYIKEFEQLTGIKVDLQVVAEDLFWDKITMGLSAKKPPFDLFFLAIGYDAYSYFLNNWLEPVDKYIADTKLTDLQWFDMNDINPAFRQAFLMPNVKQGKTYGLPITSETYILFYRKDIFAKQGIDIYQLKSIDDWLEVVRKITQQPGIYGAVVRGGEVGILDELTGMAFDYWGDLPYEFGKDMYFDENWNPRFTNPRIVEAFKTWAELMKKSPPGVTSFTWYDATTCFAQGLVATHWFDASLFTPMYEDINQSTVVGKVGYTVVPPTKYGHKTAFWSWGLGISSKSMEKKPSWLFMEWATSKYMEKITAPKTFGAVRTSTWELPELKEKFPPGFSEAISKSMKIAEPSLLYLGQAQEVTLRMIDALHALYEGKDPKAVMSTLQNKAIEILKEQGVLK